MKQTKREAGGDLEVRVRRECIRIVVGEGRSSSLAAVALAAALAVMVRAEVRPAIVWGWLLAMAVVAVGRVLAAGCYRKQAAETLPEARLCTRVYIGLVCLTGVLWGAGMVLLFPPYAQGHQMAVIFVAAGLTAGALPMLSPLIRLYVFYIGAALLPLSVILFLQGGELYYWMSFLIVLYTIVLINSSTHMHESLVSALENRFKNEALVKNLNTARLAAEAASLAKNEFLANMSHEIRTPMNGVLGTLQLLQGTEMDKAQREYVDLAYGSAESLLRLLNDILDFSKIEAGKLRLEETDFDLRQLVAGTEVLLPPQLKEKDIAYKSELDKRLPSRLIGDPVRLRQVLINFLTNAVKFTDQGEIKLKIDVVEKKDDVARLRFGVYDTGIGINPEDRERLFQSFTQADGSYTRKYGGTGLGLAIVRRLIDLMGAECGVESEPGRGSCFWCEVALRVADEQGDTPGGGGLQSGPVDQSLSGRILLVEDNLVNQKIALGLLKKLGLEAELAENGEEALDKVSRKDFDAVLMDCQMPVLDGYAATRTWREIEKKQKRVRLPIIAMTAHAMEGDRQKCLDAGMDDYLAKPVKKEALAEMLGRWLSPDG